MKYPYSGFLTALTTAALVGLGSAAPAWAEPTDFRFNPVYRQELKQDLQSNILSLYLDVQEKVKDDAASPSISDDALPAFLTRIADVFFNGISVKNSIDVVS